MRRLLRSRCQAVFLLIGVAVSFLGFVPTAQAQAPYTVTTMGAQFHAQVGDAGTVWTGQYVYIFGGLRAGQCIDEIHRYEPSTDTLTLLPLLLPWVLCHPSAVWDGTYAYLFGGDNGPNPALDSILRFDPVAGAIAPLPNSVLPVPMTRTGAVWDGTHAYVIGSGGPTVKFNPATGAMTSGLAAKPGPSFPFGETVLMGGKVYVTSQIVNGACCHILEYDPAADAWATMSAMSQGSNGDAMVVTDGQVAYILGGQGGADAPNAVTDQIVCFDPVADVSTVLGVRLPSPRDESEAVWTGNAAYVFSDGSQGLREVVRFTSLLGPGCQQDASGATPPASQCGEPLYLDAGAPGVTFGDARVNPSQHGAAGSRIDSAATDLNLALQASGGAFAYKEAAGGAASGWSLGDTLVWGPMQGLGSATSYVVLSTGEWPGQAGGYAYGTILDGGAVGGLAGWGTTAAFEFQDQNANGAEPIEPMFAVRAGGTLVHVGDVDMAPGPSGWPNPGTYVLNNHPGHGLIVAGTAQLRFFDTNGNGYYDLEACAALPVQPPTVGTCGEPIYVEPLDGGGTADESTPSDLRITRSTAGLPGSRVQASDADFDAAAMAGNPLNDPGGSFAYVEADSTPGWSLGDTLLWGPMAAAAGTDSYVVLSQGGWPGQSGNPGFGTVLDASIVTAPLPWKAGATFRFLDEDGDLDIAPNEPGFAIQRGADVLEGDVHLDAHPAASTTVGQHVTMSDTDLGVAATYLGQLRFFDHDSNGYYDRLSCLPLPQADVGANAGSGGGIPSIHPVLVLLALGVAMILRGRAHR